MGVHPCRRPRQGAESEGGVGDYITCVEMIIRLLGLGMIIGLLEVGIGDYVSLVDMIKGLKDCKNWDWGLFLLS